MDINLKKTDTHKLNSFLIKAVCYEDVDSIESLINKGIITPNIRLYLQVSPNKIIEYPILIHAIRQNSFSVLKKLIELEADVNQLDSNCWSPLFHAHYLKNKEIINLLKENNAQFDIINPFNNKTRLMTAIENKDLFAVSFMINLEPELVDTILPNGQTPLILATELKQDRIFHTLLRCGADINKLCPAYNNFSALMIAARNNDIYSLKKIIENGGKFNFSNIKEQEFLGGLVKNNQDKIVITLIKKLGLFLDNETMIKIIKKISESTNTSVFKKKYSPFLLKHLSQSNYFFSFIYIASSYSDLFSAKHLNDTLCYASKKGNLKVVALLTSEFLYMIDSNTIGMSAYYAAKHNCFHVTKFLFNKFSRVIEKRPIKKVLTLSAKNANLYEINFLLSIPEVEELACANNNHLLRTIEKKSVYNPLVFQPIIDRLLQAKSVAELANKQKLKILSLFSHSFKNDIFFGPINIDKFTKQLEWIVKFTLRHPGEALFFVHENVVYVKIMGVHVNVSHLLKMADLSHIFLSQEDSDCFNTNKYLSSSKIKKIRSGMPPNYILPGQILTEAEITAVYKYTGKDHERINAILHEDSLENFSQRDKRLKNVFLKQAFLSSALNKIMPSWTRDPEKPAPKFKTYRGERYISAIEIKERISRLQSSIGGIIKQQPAFCSTSSNSSTASDFVRDSSEIHYKGHSGKNIQPLSKYGEENEFLQPPGHIRIYDHKINNNTCIFKAECITPLFKKYRSIRQEYQFKELINKTNSKLITSKDKKKENLNFIEIEGFSEEFQYVYDHFLSKEFTDDWCLVDWELETPQGIIPRPNHGLAHIMRVTQLAKIVFLFLKQYDMNNIFSLSKREIYIIQLTAIFSVVGRKNESGFNDMEINQSGYRTYKQASAEAFINYVDFNQFLNMNSSEILSYSNNILKMGEPGEDSPSAIILALAHKLDLLRCYSSERVFNDIYKPLRKYLPKSEVFVLMQYAEDLLHATGNRVMNGKIKCDYDDALFYMVSTNVELCLNAILDVPPPSPESIDEVKLFKCRL